jgi:hypothetical protein
MNIVHNLLRRWEYRRYRYLWTTEQKHWCLVEVNDPNDRFVGYVILNPERGRELLIERRDISQYVLEQMIKGGARIYSAAEWNAILDEDRK